MLFSNPVTMKVLSNTTALAKLEPVALDSPDRRQLDVKTANNRRYQNMQPDRAKISLRWISAPAPQNSLLNDCNRPRVAYRFVGFLEIRPISAEKTRIGS